jgi:type IV pilus assembly protein PilC
VEFRCRLASASGQITEALYQADSEDRLRHELEAQGLCVLSLRPARLGAGLTLRLPRRSGIPTAELLIFNQELATLLRAGMPLVQSLDLLKNRVDTPVFRRVLDDVYQRVRAGSALSEAFDAHGDVLPAVYTASLLAGERSGNLDGVLRRFVEYSRIISSVKRKTLSALVYPAILIALALALVAVIVLNVVPAFTDFYATFDEELPALTQFIVGLSTFVRSRFLLLLLGLVVTSVAFTYWIQMPGQKARFDRAVLRVPMLGDVARKFATSQMARTLATLLGGGLPLVNAIEITSRAVGNRFMASELAAVATRVREGSSFAASLDARGVFPDVAVKMTEVGESTGALQDMLNAVADFFDEDIATRMDRFVTLVEPTLLVILGIVIAALLLALYLPLFQLSSVLA